MRKKTKRKMQRYALMAVITLVVFCIGFLLAGGKDALRPGTINHLQELGELGRRTQSNTQPAENTDGKSDSALTEAARRAGESLPSADEAKEQARRLSAKAGDIADGFIPRLKRIVFLRDAVRQSTSELQHLRRYEEISPLLTAAIVSVEDSRFFNHHGFDLSAIARAALVNLQYGKIEEGASTITQQLVKNLFLTHDRTFVRKLDELALALDVELHYNKEEILTLYLNTIYFGSGFYGIDDAARGYFGKAPAELNLAEAAMLAGLPNAPSLYSPYEDFMLAKKRQFIVLDSMVRTGAISEAEAADAKIQPLYLAK